MRKRTEYTGAQKLALLEELKASGLAVEVFAKTKGMHPSALYRWSKGRDLGDRKIARGPRGPQKRKAKSISPIVLRKFASTADGELAIRVLDAASVAQDIGAMRALIAAARHILSVAIL